VDATSRSVDGSADIMAEGISAEVILFRVEVAGSGRGVKRESDAKSILRECFQKGECDGSICWGQTLAICAIVDLVVANRVVVVVNRIVV